MKKGDYMAELIIFSDTIFFMVQKQKTKDIGMLHFHNLIRNKSWQFPMKHLHACCLKSS